MKQVIVLRHADWDNVTDELTESGRQQCAKLAPNTGPFAIVVSSPTIRTQQTAELLSSKRPIVDNRAGTLKSDPKFLAKITEMRKNHPLGVAGALFSIPELREPLRLKGQELKELIEETLAKLEDGQQALIVSHDGMMVALYKAITGETFDTANHTYGTLQGFRVDESLNPKAFRAN